MKETEFTATDLQRRAFEALQLAKEKGEIHIHHKTLGSFKITPEKGRQKINFGVLSGKIQVNPYAFKDWSKEVEADFDM